MITIHIKSYDEHFDTFEIRIDDGTGHGVVRSLIPALMLPYIAPQLVKECDDLPYAAIGRSFTLTMPKQ